MPKATMAAAIAGPIAAPANAARQPHASAIHPEARIETLVPSPKMAV